MCELLIRPMEFTDILEVHEIEQKCFTLPWSIQSLRDDLKNKFTRYVVAVAEGGVVGYGGMWLVIDEAHITNIAVDENYRKRSVATKILKELMHIAQKHDVLFMTLEVRKSNQAAISLYEGMGFKKEGLRKAYYSDNNEDAIIMWTDRLS